MKKQISTSKLHCIVSYILIFVAAAMSVICCFLAVTDDANMVILLLGSCFYTFMCIFFVFLSNRINCWIWIEEDGYIKRKGFWFGFEKEIRIEDIKCVETSYFGRGGEYLNLITNEEGSVNRASKNSYISLLHTKKNLVFLSSFWNGAIDGHIRWKTQL